MAFRVIKQRREARRLLKMEEIFAKNKQQESETISVDDVADIFKMYGVDYKESMVKDMDSYQDRCIGKDDFFKLATDVQLLDFTARKMKMPVGEKKKRKDKDGEKVSKQNPKNFDHSGIQNLDELLFKSMKPEKSKQRFNILSQTYHALWPYYSVVFNTPKKTAELEPVPVRGGLGYWCCTDGSTSPDIENPDDRVEVAFRRLDFNRDGYLTEEDFLEIQWPLIQGDVESSQLQRIFQHCDQTGDGRVSLQEFRELANSKGDLTLEGMPDY